MAKKPAARAAQPDAPASRDIVVDQDGLATMTMKTSLSGPDACVGPGDPYRCDPAEARRLRDAGFAEQPAA